MNFSITQESSLGLKTYQNAINELKIGLEAYFKEKNYGASVNEFIIHLICVDPKHEHFFKVKKPRYYKGKQEFLDHGIKVEVKNTLVYDLKINFVEVEKKEKSEVSNYLKDIILSSTSIIKQLNIHDFDLELFKHDLAILLRK